MLDWFSARPSRSLFAAGHGTVLVVLLLTGLLAAGPAHAQSAGGDAPAPPRLQGPGGVGQYLQGHIEQLPAALRDRLPAPVQQKLRTRRRRRAWRASSEPRPPAVQDIGGLPEVGSSQSWVLNENPEPQYNFDRTGTPRYAGDVDGDGINDYLYAAPAARDERTPTVLEDETGKTAVFFGGTPDDTPDQFFYAELVPVGDLNGDGFDDAMGINRADSTIRLYVGAPFVGYQDSGIDISVPAIPPRLVVRGFSDVDGDGFEDVLLGSRRQDAFVIAYGAATPAGAAVEVYNPGSPRFSFQYNVAELGGAAGTEVVRLVGRTAQNMNIRLQVFEIGTDRSLTEAQNVPVEELQRAAQRHELSLVDIDGSGEPEMATTGPGPMFVFPQAGSGGVSFVDTPLTFAKDDARPVGDLDGDGRHDFYTFDDSTETRYISFGPPTLDTGLSFDTEIPYGDDVVGAPQFLPQGGLGDVTGDGRPDAVLGLTDRAAETVGRRFFSVNSDGSGRPPVDLSFPRGHFFDAIVGTQEIGDFNADGTHDIAMVRASLSQVEIFYGGTSISAEPDLTLEAPVIGGVYLNVTSGDVNGDGASDLVVGYNAGNQLDVYLGGAGADAQVDHVIEPDNFGFGGVYIPKIVGDVNGDGIDDLLATDLGFFGEQQNLAVFFGDSSLPTTPDATLQYASGAFAGATAAAPGDLNGDGVDDLAVGRPNFANETTARGRVDVFFGGSAFSFSGPDLTLRPETPSAPIFQFAHGLAGGDFDGDGHGDLAVRPLAALPTAPPSNVTISIFRGGPDVDEAVDRRLSVPAGTGVGQDLDGDGGANVLRGRLAPLHASGEADGLVQGTASPTNALLYQSATATAPVAVFRAPNQDAGMGNAYFNGLAAGEVTGDDQPDVVIPQTNDDNEAAASSRVYRYTVPANLPPGAEADSFSTPQGQTLSVSAPGVLGNDADPDGDGLSASLVTGVTNGSLTLDSDGAFEYTPAAGFTGPDSFVYEASDGSASDTATVHLQVGDGQRTREVPVASGWNLLSVPLPTEAPGFGAVFPMCQSGFFFEPGSGYNEIGEGETVPVGDGLFANCSAGTATITGPAPDSSTIDVTQGWNLIGPLADSISVGSITSDPPGIVQTSFFGFDQTDGYAEASALAPGDGYWVKVSESGTLDLSGSGGGAALASAPPASRSRKQPGVLLRLTDAAGRTATLRLAKDLSEKRLQRAALPPVPPGETFDVRFEGGRSVAEASPKALKAIETQGLKAPVTLELANASEGQSLQVRHAGSETRLTAENSTVELSQVEDLAVGLQAAPEAFALKKTYPNPASGQATVAYAVPKQSDVTIAVYDVLGRRVATLADGAKQAGRHTAVLDAGQLPSGTYFVRMRAEGFQQTRRLTVVR